MSETERCKYFINIPMKDQNKLKNYVNAFAYNFGEDFNIIKDEYDKTYSVVFKGRNIQVGIDNVDYICGWMNGCIQASLNMLK